MRKTAILLALACAFARADYGPGTTDSDLLRSGTPVVTNAWLAVSNETAGLVRSMAGDKITDGTNMIDAARNVYLVRDNCWIRNDGLVLVPDSELTDTWVSITNTTYGEVSLYNSGSMWEEFETAIPTFLFRDGATLTNDDGVVVYRAGEYNSIVGRLALTNDIPTVTPPDFTTNNAQLVATIEAKAPAPGDYATVSNRAMSALQSHQSLWPAVQASTNYTDAALGAFASTGAVARAASYGTDTQWTDATGCVWEVANYWTLHYVDHEVCLTSYVDKVDSGWVFGWPDDVAPGRTGTLRYGIKIYDDKAELSIGEYYGDHIDDYYFEGPNVEADVIVDYDGGNYIDFSGQINDTYMIWGKTNLVGRVALTNDIPDVSGYATTSELNGAISTNNPAFVAAVTNCPVSHQGGGGADWPIGDFGQYGTIGAIIAALVAAATWLKNHLRYELHDVVLTGGAGTLLDRAGNRVEVTGDTTLTLPAAVAGYLRDFLVRLEISGSTVPTITFAAPTGETLTYETDGDEFPVSDEAGDWLYSFTESCVAHKFAVSLKKVNEVAAPQAQGGV